MRYVPNTILCYLTAIRFASFMDAFAKKLFTRKIFVAVLNGHNICQALYVWYLTVKLLKTISNAYRATQIKKEFINCDHCCINS